MTVPFTTKFLLLLGPSGVGKSRIIWALKELDPRYCYISPYTNRRLREGETDKVYVSDVEMDRMATDGEFLVINEKFDFRYATPRGPIISAFEDGRFPLLDWPVDRFGIMQDAFPDRLYVAYVRPPSLEVLADRLRADGRDPEGVRLREAATELGREYSGEYAGLCDLVVVNNDGAVAEVARTVHENYVRSLG